MVGPYRMPGPPRVTPETIEHGTNTGYNQHGNLFVKIDEQDSCGCREAHRVYMRMYRDGVHMSPKQARKEQRKRYLKKKEREEKLREKEEYDRLTAEEKRTKILCEKEGWSYRILTSLEEEARLIAQDRSFQSTWRQLGGKGTHSWGSLTMRGYKGSNDNQPNQK